MLFLLKAFLYKFLSLVLQHIYTALYGPSSSQLSQHGLLSYEVVYDWKSFYFTQAAPELFTLKFRGVKGLEYLERDDVTLYTASCTRFVFVRTRPDVDIHNTELHPFVCVSKHDNAVEILIVSRELVCQYLASAGKLDRDCSNTTILYNIGRCGSTLLAAMMYKTQQYQVMSEPWPVRDLLKYIHKVLPEIKECFMYRDLKPTIISSVKAYGDKFTLSFVEDMVISQLPGYLQEIWKQNRVLTKEHILMYKKLAIIHIYQTENTHRESESRPRVKCYSYESLVEDPTSFCRSFFTDIGLDHVHIPTALVAMEKDSQANSVLAKEILLKLRGVSRDDVWEWGVKMGRVLGVELEGEQCRVANIGG